MTDITPVPILKDNYAYILRVGVTTAVVDPGDAGPVDAFLKDRKWALDYIFLTHHHGDHVNGAAPLKSAYGAKIVAPAHEPRVHYADLRLEEGADFKLNGLKVEIIAVPGHTAGHVAYYLPQKKALFSGDTLFSLGCGRIFEGTMEEMWTSLQKLAALPGDTQIYCGHEYTEANGLFALTVDPDNPDLLERMADVNAARLEAKPTLPVSMDMERKTNPFLRAGSAERFGELRRMKDSF